MTHELLPDEFFPQTIHDSLLYRKSKFPGLKQLEHTHALDRYPCRPILHGRQLPFLIEGLGGCVYSRAPGQEDSDSGNLPFRGAPDSEHREDIHPLLHLSCSPNGFLIDSPARATAVLCLGVGQEGGSSMDVQFVKTAVLPQGTAPADEADALRTIELCGRTAYKSEDKITEDSARSFVLMLKKHGHLSVLEHSNVVLRIRNAGDAPGTLPGDLLPRLLGPRMAYHRIHEMRGEGAFALAGNLRGWIETLDYIENRNSDMHRFLLHALNRFFPSIFEAHERAAPWQHIETSLVDTDEQLAWLRKDPSSDLPVFVFKFVCDRGITHEVVRHRVLSFTQESTRYVNYRNRGMTLILPEELYPYYDDETTDFPTRDPLVTMWIDRAKTIFEWYRQDLGRGARPEIARDILPNLLKSEIFVSGRWSGWKHFVLLRDSSHAHPRIRGIAREVRKHFESIGMKFD